MFVHGSSAVPIYTLVHTCVSTHAYTPTQAGARTQRVHRPIHNIPGRNTAWGATSRRWFHRTTPRDGNGRDNYLDSGGYMLPSAAWDPATSFPWCPRWCKPGTCPPEAMERIYPPPSSIGNDILFPLRSPSLFPAVARGSEARYTRAHASNVPRIARSQRIKSYVLDPRRDAGRDIDFVTETLAYPLRNRDSREYA